MDTKYEITALLSKDRSGGVYRAHDPVLDREVALRRFFALNGEPHPEEWNQKFLETTQFLSSLQHPSLLPILDTGVDLDGAFSVYPLLKGEVLSEAASLQPLDEATVRNMAVQLLGALSVVHSAGGAHRALSPSSVFVTRLGDVEPRFTIMDLGLSALTPNSLGGRTSRDPAFLPIEQLELSPITPQSDCYQLGHILYFSLLGGHPWAGLSREECSSLHLKEVLPPLSNYIDGISEEFQAWLYRLTSNNAELRFQNAEQALQALENQTSTPPKNTAAVNVSTHSSQSQLSSQQAVTKGLIGTLVALLLITSATAVFVFSRSRDSVHAPTETAQKEPIPPIENELMDLAPPAVLPCVVAQLYTTTSPTQHPRAACQILDHDCRDWKVFTAPGQQTRRHSNPESDMIGEPQANGDVLVLNQSVGNLVFFNENGTLYLPSLYAKCQTANSGWKIPLRIPKNLENDLKITIHFSTWGCGSAIKFQSSQPSLESEIFSTPHAEAFSSQAVSYTIPLAAVQKLSQLDVILTSSDLSVQKEHGVSLNALIVH